MSARTWALTGSMRTIDSDSDTVAAELVWRPEAGGGVDHVSASLTVELPIDLGAMGATTVFVPVPLHVLRDAYAAAHGETKS